MSQPIGMNAPEPIVAPLLPQEIVRMEAAGINPDDFMALWVPPLPNEQGYSFGATPDGRVIGVQVAGMFTSSALSSTRESGLVVVAPAGSALEVLTVGIRMIVKRSGMRLSAVVDNGWKVKVYRPGGMHPRLDTQIPLLGTFAITDCYERETFTLYEAQTIAAKLDREIARLGLADEVQTTIEPMEMQEANDTNEPDAPLLRAGGDRPDLSVLFKP